MIVFLLFLTLCSSFENNVTKEVLFKKLDDDRNLAHQLIDYVYQKYPYYLKNFMDFDAKKVSGVMQTRTFQTTALEIKRNQKNYSSYELLLTEVNDKRLKNLEFEYKTSLFLCSRGLLLIFVRLYSVYC